MRLRFNLGKRFGRLTPAEQRVLDRLKRGEITAEQAERELGGYADVKEWRVQLGETPDEPETEPGPPANETPEEAKARELVERIAREVDAERELER